ncbi:hypothetical protein [Sphingomonas alpina]|uniref:Uncharacterized protein n=1 Tax=Sphingomonas alpina TaxID=653931 RepID=A0A7H0LHZ4_9SPHN|nr:hypothetical protein [Sphingomonas alpina]QNQ09297.1 hypothetical protein H3Z74_21930 [Sphingomonas alpina]
MIFTPFAAVAMPRPSGDNLTQLAHPVHSEGSIVNFFIACAISLDKFVKAVHRGPGDIRDIGIIAGSGGSRRAPLYCGA